MSRVRVFFDRNEKVLSGVASVATIAALVFAGVQLRQANSSLEASTVYALQKDGRELLKDLRAKTDVYDYILSKSHPERVEPKLAAEIDFSLTQIFQYFSAVVNQRRNGVISDAYWQTFDREMCGLLHLPAPREFWEMKASKGRYSDDFKKWGTDCLSTAAPNR